MRVFSAAFPDELMEIPEGLSPLDAIFVPNMETAVNFVMDGQPHFRGESCSFRTGDCGATYYRSAFSIPVEKSHYFRSVSGYVGRFLNNWEPGSVWTPILKSLYPKSSLFFVMNILPART